MISLDLHTSKESINAFFAAHPHWNLNDTITGIEKAGEGNMNVVLRVQFESGRSVILKQSKPYVYKYPDIPAPEHRIEVEHAFYQSIVHNEVIRSMMPACLGFDESAHLIVLEDLGRGTDYTYIYTKNSSSEDDPGLEAVRFLSHLHQLKPPTSFPANTELRKLNAEHLFEYPYQTHAGFDLDRVQPGLSEVARPFVLDVSLKTALQTLKTDYLAQGDCLIHGDFYPGSWLKTTRGFKIIDPEFSFIGNPAYDIGILIAHFKMARRSDHWITSILKEYRAPSGFDTLQMWSIAGMEIIRRLIGLAQLPVDLTLDEKKIILDWACSKILN